LSRALPEACLDRTIAFTTIGVYLTNKQQALRYAISIFPIGGDF